MAVQNNQTIHVSNMTADELQESRLYIFVPAIASYFIVMLIGIVGNLLILYIIGFQYSTSTYRILLLSLAFFDAIGTFIYMPLIIYEQFVYYDFQSQPACKIVKFLAHYVGAGSATTLLVISIERYTKICKPLSKQMTPGQAKWIFLVVALLVANALSIPVAMVREVGEDKTIHDGYIVKTSECQLVKESGLLLFAKVWQGFLLLLVASYTVIMAVLYYKIWRKIHEVVRAGHSMHIKRNELTSISQEISPSDTDVTSDDPTTSQRDTVTSKHTTPSKHSTQYNASRIAKMSLALTLVFVITYAPGVSLNVVQALNPKFVEGLKPSARSAYEFFYKTNIINFVANPFIYGFMDYRFRAQLKKMFRCKG